jgi:hypothetical protein
MAGGKGQPSFARGQTRHEGQKPQDIKLLPDHDNMALVAGTNNWWARATSVGVAK